MGNLNAQWEAVKADLDSLPIEGTRKVRCRLFMKSSQAVIQGNQLIILVPNNLVKGVLEKEYIEDIHSAVDRVYTGSQKIQQIKIQLLTDFNPKKQKITSYNNPRNNIQLVSGMDQHDSSTYQAKSINSATNNKKMDVAISKTISSESSDFSKVNYDVKKKGYIPAEGEHILSVNDLYRNSNSVLQSNLLGIRQNQNQEVATVSIQKKDSRNISPVSSAIRILSDEEIRNNPFYAEDTINPLKNFENFVEGPTNEALCITGKQVAMHPGNTQINPFFVYGDSGLGKTHILYAIGNEIKKLYPKKIIMYFSLESFFQNYLAACSDYQVHRDSQSGLVKQFKTLYRNLDVLLIDDIQALMEHTSITNEFVNLLNDVIQAGHQVIFAASSHPSNYRSIEGRLRDRLLSGTTIKVIPPDIETRRKIIVQKVKERNLKFNQQSVEFIAGKFATNVRQLEGHINTIMAYIPEPKWNTVVDVDLVKTALRDVLATKTKLITVDNIKETVAEYFGITVKDIDSTARPASIAHPRMMAMAIARDLTGQSFPSLGKQFGGKDHSTVMNAMRKITALCLKDQKAKEDYDNLKLRLTD